MNFSLHLTDDCNMRCSYCPNHKCDNVMSEDVLIAACDLAFSKGNSAGLCFFGGEPLLEKELIYKAIDYCKNKSKETGKKFSCKMTTNGTLLDEEFLDMAKSSGMEIGISFDGLCQDKCRRFSDGSSSFETAEKNVRMLLKKLPMSYAMMTIAPEAAEDYYDSVKYLHELGFRRITATLAYGKKVCWTDAHLAVIKEQLEKISVYYEKIMLRGERLFFSPFDAKIRECISGYNPAERCHLGFRQMPVAPDGKIYPCTQFIGDKDFLLGNVFDGIDTAKQTELAKRSGLPDTCRECELRTRCTNSCGCLNRLETGSENKVSPLQCTYERMLIEISDALAERLCTADRDKFEKRYAKKH